MSIYTWRMRLAGPQLHCYCSTVLHAPAAWPAPVGAAPHAGVLQRRRQRQPALAPPGRQLACKVRVQQGQVLCMRRAQQLRALCDRHLAPARARLSFEVPYFISTVGAFSSRTATPRYKIVLCSLCSLRRQLRIGNCASQTRRRREVLHSVVKMAPVHKRGAATLIQTW